MKDYQTVIYCVLCCVLIHCTSNSTPVIEEVSATPAALPPVGSTTLYAKAIDEDGDSITYTWHCISGRLSATSGQSVEWNAPIQEGTYRINVSVEDEYGAISRDHVDILVSSTFPSKPEVDYIVCNTGGSLKLLWPYEPNIDAYNIYADGELLNTTISNEYEATIPAKIYEVSACFGTYESEKTKIDFTPVVTSNINIYGHMSGWNFPSAISFTEDGATITWMIEDTTYWAFLDYYFVDSRDMQIASPDVALYDTIPFNRKHHTSKNSGLTDFNALDSADIIASYTIVTNLSENAVYSLWLDSNANGWDDSVDHFAKMKVENIVGGLPTKTATLTIAYQKIPGLRWLVTR